MRRLRFTKIRIYDVRIMMYDLADMNPTGANQFVHRNSKITW